MWEIVQKGGFVMYPLLLSSFISLTIVIERFLFWTVERFRYDVKSVYRILDLVEKNDYERALKAGNGSKCYLVRILMCGILHRDFSLISAMEMAANDEIKKMRRFLGILDTIITMAPLLGILGTVIGIIDSFDMLGQASALNPKVVSKGISQALITTATGLSIAIITLIPYNYFLSKLRECVTIIEKYTTSLEIVHNRNHENKNRKS